MTERVGRIELESLCEQGRELLGARALLLVDANGVVEAGAGNLADEAVVDYFAYIRTELARKSGLIRSILDGSFSGSWEPDVRPIRMLYRVGTRALLIAVTDEEPTARMGRFRRIAEQLTAVRSGDA